MRLRENLLYHVAEIVRQAEVAPVVAVRELRVVEAQGREDRRVQVVDVDAVFRRAGAELVGRAIGCSPLYTATRKPGAEPAAVVIAAGVGAAAAVARHRSSELPAPDDQGVIEQP